MDNLVVIIGLVNLRYFFPVFHATISCPPDHLFSTSYHQWVFLLEAAASAPSEIQCLRSRSAAMHGFPVTRLSLSPETAGHLGSKFVLPIQESIPPRFPAPLIYSSPSKLRPREFAADQEFGQARTSARKFSIACQDRRSASSWYMAPISGALASGFVKAWSVFP